MSQSHGNTDYLIFSVYNKNLTELDNAINHRAVLSTMEGMGVLEAQGVYLGDAEQSFIISADHEQFVKDVCKIYEQECYLKAETHWHGLRKASFVYPDDTTEFMGYLRSVSEQRAKASDGYTYRADIDTYWIIDDTDETDISKLH